MKQVVAAFGGDIARKSPLLFQGQIRVPRVDLTRHQSVLDWMNNALCSNWELVALSYFRCTTRTYHYEVSKLSVTCCPQMPRKEKIPWTSHRRLKAVWRLR